MWIVTQDVRVVIESSLFAAAGVDQSRPMPNLQRTDQRYQGLLDGQREHRPTANIDEAAVHF
jgi:hypothetical protein